MSSLPSGGRYALLLLSASTPHGADRLFQTNQPLYGPLGLDPAQRVLLRPIDGTLEAKSFASEYLGHGHELWKKERSAAGLESVATGRPADLLSDRDIATHTRKREARALS